MLPHVQRTKRIYPEAVDLFAPACRGRRCGIRCEGLTTRRADRTRPWKRRHRQPAYRPAHPRRDRVKLDPQVRVIAAQCRRRLRQYRCPRRHRAGGILVTNTPGILSDTTADFAFALLMAAARRVVEAHAVRALRQNGSAGASDLHGRPGHASTSRTLGILGMGRIGQAMARRGIGFSMRILYALQ